MWYFDNQKVESISDIPEGVIGFVYIITNLETGEFYVGKKAIYSTRTLPPLKGYKRKRKVVKESSWLTYESSSEKVREWERKKKHVLEYGYSKKQLTYLETKYLFKLDALEDPKCVNENILGKFFKGEFSKTLEN